MTIISKLYGDSEKIHNPLFLDIYRVISGVIGVLYSINAYRYFDFLFFNRSFEIRLVFFCGLLSWGLLSLLMLLGVTNKLYRIVTYVVALVLLTRGIGIYTVECKFYIMMSFFNIFMPFNRTSDERDERMYVVHLMLLSVTAYLFFGGFYTKILDPYWVKGLGVYFVLLLPYIKSHHLDSVLQFNFLMKVTGYFALIVEGTSFFASLSRYTRNYAIIAFGCFSFFLGLVLKINLIGLEAIAMFVCFLSITSYKFDINLKILDDDFFVNKCKLLAHIKNPIKGLSRFGVILSPFERTFLLASFAIILFYRILFLSNNIFSLSFLPEVVSKLKPVEGINFKTFNVNHDVLFTKEHFIDVGEYKIILKTDTNENLEPLLVFMEDQTAGPDSGSFFASRWLQAEMYRVARLNKRIQKKEQIKELPIGIIALLEFAKSKSKKEVKSIHLFYSEIEMPVGFNKKYKRMNSQFEEILIYYPQTKSFEIR